MAETKALGALLNKAVVAGSKGQSLTPFQTSQANLVISRYGAAQKFLEAFAPENGSKYAQYPSRCICGSAPTLAAVKNAYGENIADLFMRLQIIDLNAFFGASDDSKRMSDAQIGECSRVILSEYGYLKASEFLLFFNKFKAGAFGRFYGSVDAITITKALHDYTFGSYRNGIKDRFDASVEEAKRQRRSQEKTCTYEEFLAMQREQQNAIENDDL